MTDEQGRKANITGAFWLCCPLQKSRRRPLAAARKERKRLSLCLSDRWSCKNRPTDRLTQRVTNMLTQRLLAAAAPAPLICDWGARKKKEQEAKPEEKQRTFMIIDLFLSLMLAAAV